MSLTPAERLKNWYDTWWGLSYITVKGKAEFDAIVAEVAKQTTFKVEGTGVSQTGDLMRIDYDADEIKTLAWELMRDTRGMGEKRFALLEQFVNEVYAHGFKVIHEAPAPRAILSDPKRLKKCH